MFKSTSNKTTGVFHGLETNNSTKSDKQKFEYLLIMKFSFIFMMIEQLKKKL